MTMADFGRLCQSVSYGTWRRHKSTLALDGRNEHLGVATLSRQVLGIHVPPTP